MVMKMTCRLVSTWRHTLYDSSLFPIFSVHMYYFCSKIWHHTTKQWDAVSRTQRSLYNVPELCGCDRTLSHKKPTSPVTDSMWIQNWTFVRLHSACYLSFQYNHWSCVVSVSANRILNLAPWTERLLLFTFRANHASPWKIGVPDQEIYRFM
jgi:hypothetical protein